MNSNDALSKARLAASCIRKSESPKETAFAADDLLIAFEELDKILSSGGSLPDEWQDLSKTL